MSAVPGSLFRRIVFWAHLGCGIAAGVFILAMSATGVLLTYERQMLDAAARRHFVHAPPTTPLLDADQIAQHARNALPPGTTANLTFDAATGAPVTVTPARGTALLLNPYDGTTVADASASQRQFFRLVTRWHRYLGAGSDSVAAKLVDYGNLLFLFIIVSGIYIWLPHIWRWRTLRGLMFFKVRYINAKVRDFNWHHVFSFWMLVPLFIIALSGVMISFPWANRLVYAAYGEPVPARRGQQSVAAVETGGTPAPGGSAAHASLERLRQVAMAEMPGWRRLTIPMNIPGEQVEITAEIRSEAPRPPRQTITLSSADAAVIRLPPPQQNAQTPGQRARSWLRFAHTGEQFGIIGQTIAGIASLAACFLVYTGLALAWRRLIRPLFRRGDVA